MIFDDLKFLQAMKITTKSLLFGLLIFLFGTVYGQEVSHKHSVYHGFFENKGQWDEQVLFKSQFEGGNLWVEQHKLMFHLMDYSKLQKAHGNPSEKIDNTDFRQHIVNINFENSNRISQIEKGAPSKSYYNYFLGNDKSKWASDVHTYYEATLKNLYNGINLKLIEQVTNLKYEFHVAPGANPNDIVLNINGFKKMSTNKKGELVIETELGNIVENAPYSYQIINGKIKEVTNHFQIKDSLVTFKLGEYNKKYELIIDPVLIFATYSGSVTDNFGMTATYCHDGSGISGGTIYGNQYPTPDPNAYNTTSNLTVTNVSNSVTTDVFISKYSPDGSQMIWTTFFGGGNNQKGTETVHSLICDEDDNVYFFGATSSSDIPIVNGYQTTHSGGQALMIYYNGVNFDSQGVDIYVGKLSANGHNLLGSTYMGGSGNDGLNYTVTGAAMNYSGTAAYDSVTINYGDQFRGEIMLDNNKDIIITSSSRSTNFPMMNPIQGTAGGQQDGVIFKLSNDLSNLLFSTYIGGSKNDACYSVKITQDNSLIIAGATSSTNLPATPGVWQSTYNGGKSDGFVLKLPPSLSSIQAMTYIGTNQLDHVFFVEVDRDDNVYLLGSSQGGNFPVINATYSNPNSGQFIMKMNPTLSTVEHSTVFGNGNGQINISPSAFLVDICGNIYVSGWGANLLQDTPLNGMPTTSDAFQPNPSDGFDFYLSVFDRDFSQQIYGTYMGSMSSQEHVDGGTSRFDKNGVVYQSVCGGCGGYSDFPTTQGAWSNNNLSYNCNNIIFKFDFEITPKAVFTTDVLSGCSPLTVNFTNFSVVDGEYVWDFGNGDLDSTTFNPTRTFDTPGDYDVYLYVKDPICQLIDTAHTVIHVTDPITVSVQDIVTLCQSTPISVTATSSAAGVQWQWSSNNQFTDQLNSSSSDSTLNVTPIEDSYYYVKVTKGDCEAIDSVHVIFQGTGVSITGGQTICEGESITLTANNENPNFTMTYTWEPSSAIVSQPNDNQAVVYLNTSSYIHIIATSSDGCIVEDSVWIEVGTYPDDEVTASASETHLFEGQTTTLTAQPAGLQYTWTPAESLTSPNSQVTEASPTGTTTYTVSASNGTGCYKSDTVTIFIDNFICDNPFVFIPNAFTPNGDGDNDVLYVRSAVVSKVLLRIFNRWGEMVFETENQHEGWDGTYKGRDCDPDVYDYYLKVTCIDEQTKIIKGNVTLMR